MYVSRNAGSTKVGTQALSIHAFMFMSKLKLLTSWPNNSKLKILRLNNFMSFRNPDRQIFEAKNLCNVRSGCSPVYGMAKKKHLWDNYHKSLSVALWCRKYSVINCFLLLYPSVQLIQFGTNWFGAKFLGDRLKNGHLPGQLSAQLSAIAAQARILYALPSNPDPPFRNVGTLKSIAQQKISWSLDFEALKLWKGRSGCLNLISSL